VADPKLKGRGFTDKVLPVHWPKHEPEVEDAQASFQEARARSRESVMLDVRLSDGRIESFAYAYLTRVRFIPGDVLVLRFGADEIRAEGRNLARVRDALSEHRMRFIQEGTAEDDGAKPDEAPHIGRIEITERETL
jgi:hypothetical protein